jgi:hypothetical protein
MNLPQINTNLFKQLRFILVETSRAGNIGAVARAMKTMGYSDLVLVNPRFDDALHDPKRWRLPAARRIFWPARVVGSMAEALEGINSPPPCRPGCASFRRRCCRRDNWRGSWWRSRTACGAHLRQRALRPAERAGAKVMC